MLGRCLLGKTGIVVVLDKGSQKGGVVALRLHGVDHIVEVTYAARAVFEGSEEWVVPRDCWFAVSEENRSKAYMG